MDAAERSLSLLRTLSQEHIQRNSNINNSSNTNSNSNNNTSSNNKTAAATSSIDQSNTNTTSRNPNNNNSNRISTFQQINQSFSALFHKKDPSIETTSSTSTIQSSNTTVHNDYTIMGNKQTRNQNSNNGDIDIESRLAYEDYFLTNPNISNNKNTKNKRNKRLKQTSSNSSTNSSNLSSRSIDDLMYDDKAQQYYTLDELVDRNLYTVKQNAGYLSILFSLVQTVILVVMMIECSVAPLDINPMIGPYPDALDYWGAKNASKILDDNEWWRLITPLFLHGGIIHLLCNISVQLDIGAFFEREWGSGIWLIIYLASGLGSSIFSCIFSADNLSVGSSGAVMGLFGGKLAEIFCRACESRKTKAAKVSHEVRMEQLQQSLCSVLIVLAFSFVPFVDWAAHLGGVICGFTTGFLCFAPWIKTRHCAVFWFTIGIVMNAVFYIMTLSYMYTAVQPRNDLSDVCGYYKQFYEDYECNCQIE